MEHIKAILVPTRYMNVRPDYQDYYYIIRMELVSISLRSNPPGRDQDPDAVNSQNDAGYTALHHAAKHGCKELIEILVKGGADRMIENNAGETPYMVAHKFQQWEAERLLLNAEQQQGML